VQKPDIYFGEFIGCWAWRTRAALANAIQSTPSTGKTIHLHEAAGSRLEAFAHAAGGERQT